MRESDSFPDPVPSSVVDDVAIQRKRGMVLGIVLVGIFAALILLDQFSYGEEGDGAHSEGDGYVQ